MPRTGPISCLVICHPGPMRREWSCACGAKAESIDNSSYGDVEPVTVPGQLLEVCTCPRCITCGWVLDQHGRCDNLDCPLVGTLIVLPD